MNVTISKHGATRGIVSGVISALAAFGAASVPLFTIGTTAAIVTYLIAWAVAYRFVRQFARPKLAAETPRNRSETHD